MKNQRLNLLLTLGLIAFVSIGLAGCSRGKTEASSFFGPSSVTIPKGATLKVRLIPTLSTNQNKVGDRFKARLDSPIVEDGRTIAKKGAQVMGKVVEADKGGRVKGRAHLAIQLTQLETASGETVDITTNTVRREAKSTKGKDAGEIGIGAGIGAAIGAAAGGGKGAGIGAAAGAGAGTGAVLATRGAPAVLPSETVLSFKLEYPVKVS
jgi:hypothetical protein